MALAAQALAEAGSLRPPAFPGSAMARTGRAAFPRNTDDLPER
jgi:hypothetical protein